MKSSLNKNSDSDSEKYDAFIEHATAPAATENRECTKQIKEIALFTIWLVKGKLTPREFSSREALQASRQASILAEGL